MKWSCESAMDQVGDEVEKKDDMHCEIHTTEIAETAHDEQVM
jgi:hypothetical protein